MAPKQPKQTKHKATILALANQKGGVAKTTSVASLGAAFAERGQRVLLVDLDPQACLTFSLGVDPEDLELSVHHVLTKGLEPSEVIVATDDAVHGVASALLVVARMVGMLVGISALTTLGLRRYYAEQTDLPTPMEVCGDGRARCPAYTEALSLAGLEQLQAIFAGAAVCAVVAAVLALATLRAASRAPARTH